MKNITLLLVLLSSFVCNATTWNVGPTRIYTYCSQIANLVQAGDTVAIDAALYINDPQVTWNAANLYIHGIGGRPRLEAGSIIANDLTNGKGIFVVNGANTVIENIEFANAQVVDMNGAGIRQQAANIVVRHCWFNANEMGLLVGAIPNCKTTMEYNLFSNNGSSLNPGYQHNVYIGNIDTFLFRYNYSKDAIAEGHEVKTRAKYNFIMYNRISNENSIDSRTIDIPNGGTSVIVGNIIEQGINSANNNLLGYGMEGLSNAAPHRLYVVNNTFVNRKANGNYIQVQTGTDSLFVKNNIFTGANTGGIIVGTATNLDSSNNATITNANNVGFVNFGTYDYHLLASSPMVDYGIAINKTIAGYALLPTQMYVYNEGVESRTTLGTAIDIGAFEYQFNIPLPAQTLEITSVTNNGNMNQINWYTINEQNTKTFYIERSMDNQNYTIVGNIESTQNSIGKTNYSFQDNISQLIPTVNQLYYRVVMEDIDGKTLISNTIYTMLKNNEQALELYPNPAHNQITLKGLEAKPNTTFVKLIDILGNTLQTISIPAFATQTTFATHQLSKGTYYLQYQKNTKAFIIE